MKRAGMIINFLILVFGIACIAYYLALGITVRFGQSMMFLWPVIGGICILRFIIWSVIYRTNSYPPRVPLMVARIIIVAGLIFFFAVEGMILASGLTQAEQGLDYIVVLGAKVNGTEPSGALRNRIQRAADYMEENPNTIAVLSGGKGSDEEISEAQCMYNGLIERGIASERLILEETSTDTEENLRNSRAIIGDDLKVGLVTNDFHMFRALHIAKKQGWEVSGISVATTAISFPHYMMREFIGVVYGFLRGQLA